MEKTLLIAGKEIPEGEELAAGAMTHSRSVIITTAADSFSNTETGAAVVPWNRSSALSARSVVLSCMNQTGNFDEAALIFDEGLYASKFEDVNAADITRVLEELIAGYQYLSSEIIAKFKHNNIGRDEIKLGKIAFIWISAQSRSTVNVTLSPIVAAASAAFKAFAESTSKSLTEVEEILPVLVNVESAGDVARKDNTLVSWLCEYMDAMDEMKKRPAAKFFESWVKPGAKNPGGFGLFR